jgi:hypothetical protein
MGTGLRYDIWPEVKPRFGDMWIWELYASTEGKKNIKRLDKNSNKFIKQILGPL